MRDKRARRPAVQALLGAFFFIAEALPARGQCSPAIELVSDRTQFPTRAAHAVAFTGSTLGLVKLQPPAGPLFFATYDLDLEQLTADEKVADSFVERSIHIFWTGSEFGLFYETPTARLALQRISVSGSPIGEAVVIPVRFGLRSGEFDVTYDRARGLYIVAHAVTQNPDTGLWITFVDTTGTVVREQRVAFFVAQEANPRIAVAGDGTIGVLYRRGLDGTQQLLRVVSEAAVQQPETTVMTATGGNDPFLAASDDEFAIIQRLVTMSGSALNWMKIATTGEIVLPETRLFNAPGADVAAVDFQWNDDLEEWVLAHVTSFAGFAFDQGQYRLLRFRSDGGLKDEALFSPEPLRGIFLGRNNFVWTGSGYVSPASLPIAFGLTDSYLLRYCPFVVRAESNLRNASIGTPVSFAAVPSAGTSPFEFEWDLGDGTTAPGQFVQRVYGSPGVYSVTVTATDADGEVATHTITVTVYRPRPRAVRK